MKIKTAINRINKFVEEYHPEHKEVFKEVLDDFIIKRKVVYKQAVKKKKKRNKNKEITRFTKETYKQYLKSSIWKAKRKLVLNARGRVCETCGSTSKLNVHHSIYSREVLYGDSLKGLKVLCQECHNKVHEKGSLKKATKEVISNSSNNLLKNMGSVAYYKMLRDKQEIKELKQMSDRIKKQNK